MVEKVVLSTKIPLPVMEEIQRLVEEGRYMNNSDFLRIAARTELQKAKEVDA